jgi:hypothetical protein
MPLRLSLVLFIFFAFGANAQQAEPDEAGWREIRSVIEKQLDAFQRDDAETAFSFASPNIRKLFQTPENFIAMVKADYRAVYRPRSVNFLEPAVIEGLALQPVQILGPDNVAVVAIYTMQRQEDGDWKIDGCEIAPASALYTESSADGS